MKDYDEHAEAEGWNTRYEEGRTGWDLGTAPPSLLREIAAAMERHAARGVERPLRVLVPGCGRGHDALAWAQAGAEVVGLDFAALAVAEATKLAAETGLIVRYLEANVLALDPSLHGAFDVVWEQTCFCAIPREARRAYAISMTHALDQGGEFVGVFWNHGNEGGPPFDVTAAHVREAFQGLLEERALEAVADSIPARNPEFIMRLAR
ncbi:MAG: methyltransferase domain-containing protein [Nannocystaceae bacterium]